MGVVILVFGIALHCIACTGKMGMTHRPARGNGNPSEGVGEWAPLSLSRCLLVSGYDLVMRKRAFG
jgi:hypothetical protein